MSEQGKSPRIVELVPRLAPNAARAVELCTAVRQSAERHLRTGLEGFFERLDDALFDLAEKAASTTEQMHYLDGMREVRKCRPAFESAYLKRIDTLLAQLATRSVATGERSVTASNAPRELSLVDDSELEQDLAISSMVAKNEARFARELYALGQRLAVLGGAQKTADADHPLCPASLTFSLRGFMRELSADMRVKLIVYKLFDRHVLSVLGTLYADANRTLADAGVLPQLPQEPVRGHAGTTPAPVGTSTQAIPPTAGASTELLDTLRALLGARREDIGRGGAAAVSAQAAPSAGELLGALSLLQGQVSVAPTSASTIDLVALGRDVAQLKQQLLGQVGALRGERSSRVTGADEDTIDLVGMLFEFILDDRNLPTRMQALLARLQIPYLKAALLDRRLFAQRQHPARQLLDQLADAAKSWSPDSDRDGRMEALVASIVERLLHDFDDDPGIFERLGAELSAFQDAQHRRAVVAEQRVAESTRGRERLDGARRRAAREVLGRIGRDELPPLIHDLLTRAWANHLVLVLLRHGDESEPFHTALTLVDDLVALARPATQAQARAARREHLPEVERVLRQGLANVAFPDHDIDRLIARLHEHLTRTSADTLAPAASDPSPLPIPASMTAVEPEDAAEPEPPVSIVPGEPEQRSALDRVLAMQPGTWVEFCAKEAEPERAKLSWISPMSGRYLFVNRRGLKVADHAPQELVAALVDGSTRILASQPLFDRALDAIVDRLRQPGAPSDPA